MLASWPSAVRAVRGATARVRVEVSGPGRVLAAASPSAEHCEREYTATVRARRWAASPDTRRNRHEIRLQHRYVLVMATTITVIIGAADPLVFEDVQNIEITEAVIVSTTNVHNGVEIPNFGHAELATDVLDLGFVSEDCAITIEKVS